MATRFTAAAAIGLASGMLATSAAGAAKAAAIATAHLGDSVAPAVVTVAIGGHGTGPLPRRPHGGPGPGGLAGGVPASHAAHLLPVRTAPAEPQTQDPKPYSTLPFHLTAKKARSLPDTGVPMSAALGTVTALTALAAGIGTVLAARRRPDRES